MSMNNYGVSLTMFGHLDEALAVSEEALDLRRDALGSTHPHTLTSMSNCGVIFNALGRLDEAVAVKKEVWDLMKDGLGPR